MSNKKTINDAYNHLRSKGIVHTQQDVAEKMKSPKSNISRAFSGDEKYLTNSFLIRFNKTFDEIFNIDWLLTGEGSMLNTEKDFSNISGNIIAGNNHTVREVDMSYSYGSVHLQNEKEVESLKTKIELQNKEIEHLRSALEEKERLIEEKERMIQLLLKK